MEKINCPICEKDNARKIYGRGVLKRGQGLIKFSNTICRSCGLVYKNPRMDVEEIITSYRGYTKDCFSLDSAEKINKYIEHIEGKKGGSVNLDFLKEFLRPGHRVLEIGSGFGLLLKNIKDSIGCEVLGIEPADSAGYGVLKYGISIFHGSFEEYFKKFGAGEKFDAIVMQHVFEHFPEPLEILEKIKTLLRPEGVVYIEVPNILFFERRIKYFFDFWHYYNYSPGTLSKIMQKGGFKVIRRNAKKPSRVQIFAAPAESGYEEEKIGETDSYRDISRYIAKRKISDPLLTAAFFLKDFFRKIRNYH